MVKVMTLKLSHKKIARFTALLAICFALSLPSLAWRISYERANRSSLVLFDMLELHAFNAEDRNGAFAELMSSGISAFLIPECTGEEIAKGVIKGVSVVPEPALPEDVREKLPAGGATVLELRDKETLGLQKDYLGKRFGAEVAEVGACAYAIIPHNWGQLEKSGVLPDLDAVRYLDTFGVPMVFSPNLGQYSKADELLESLSYLCSSFPSVKAVCPSGEVAPDASALGKFVKDKGLLMANVEFSRILGASRLPQRSWPNVVSMHGVDRAEVIKRNIGRTAMLNRLFRAAKEREVRLLVLRLDPLRESAAELTAYCSDVKSLRARLDAEGLGRHWPEKAPSYPRIYSVLSAIALMTLFFALTAKVIGRYVSKDLLADNRIFCAVCALGVLCGVASQYVGLILRVGGAFAAGLLATEASLLAMDRWKVPLRGALEVLLFVFLGGCVVGAAFSKPLYMFRLASFSGVKISLLLPILLVLLTDLKTKEHHESLGEILGRPPIWGELALVGGVLLAGLIMIVRSGNYGFVGGTEIAFRDWLEDVLVARPRTKEFLIGYPSLVIWYYLKRKSLWAHWREAFRVGVTLAFSSAVNSFCHFHTPFGLTALRVFNGWWIGLLLGCIALLLGVKLLRPMCRRLKSLL